jgi:hypothetical protein
MVDVIEARVALCVAVVLGAPQQNGRDKPGRLVPDRIRRRCDQAAAV